MRPYITLALFILIAAISYWFLQDITEQTDTEKQAEKRFPDYFMDNFSITSMNKQGKPEYVLKAKKMLHFPDNDSAELEQPYMTFAQTDNNISLSATRAIFFKNDDIIHLYENVVIHRAASAKQSELYIYTDYLKINAQTHIAETDQAARIKTPELELNTVGLIFDNAKATLKLKSQVKGVYETTH